MSVTNFSDPFEPLIAQFAHLAVAEGLTKARRRNNPQARQLYYELRSNFITCHWSEYFGESNKLENWQRMCIDLGVEGPLTSLTKCRKVGVLHYSLPVFDYTAVFQE
jgi:hypothetical protein